MERWQSLRQWLVRVGEWAVLLPLWRRFISSQGWRIAAASGVGFFDFLHGQTGVAPNGIELHPVLAFTR